MNNMSEYTILSDSEKQKVVLLGLLNGSHEVTVDIKTHTNSIINSKSSKLGEDFNKIRTFCTLSPTVVNLLNNKGKETLEKKIEEDLQESIKTLCKSINKEENKISQALVLISLDPSYLSGNLYRIELTLLYR